MDMFRVEIYISMLRIYCHVREFMDTFIVVRLRVYGHVHCCQVESLWARSLLSG